MKPEAVLKILFPQYEGEFFPTGSEVYAYPNADSDLDFAVLDLEGYNRRQFIETLKNLGSEVENSKYFDCIKFPLLNRTINLIFLNRKNYDAWVLATKAMKAYKKYITDKNQEATTLLDKRLRCSLFEKFIVEFGGDNPQLIYEFSPNASHTNKALQNLPTDEIPF